jgi:hypothetical protein
MHLQSKFRVLGHTSIIHPTRATIQSISMILCRKWKSLQTKVKKPRNLNPQPLLYPLLIWMLWPKDYWDQGKCNPQSMKWYKGTKASGAAMVDHTKRRSKQRSHLGISTCSHHIATASTQAEAPKLLWRRCHQHGHLISTGTIRVLQDHQGQKNLILNLYEQNTHAYEMGKYHTCFLTRVSQALTVPSADEEHKK